MGCVPSQNKNQSKLTHIDYRLVWNRCLNSKAVAIHKTSKRDHPVFTQIAKDIDRTFPGHPYLAEQSNKKCFQRVLQSFALEFPKMGYTQGLNFVAGYLLINDLPEQQALKMLISLCTHPQLMLIGLFQDDFPLVRLQCELFWIIAKKTCPEGYQILKKANLPDQLWLFQWFLTLFIYSFPLSYIKEFFTFIVVKRYFAAVRIAIAILQCLQKYISAKPMKQDGFIECFQLLKTQEFCCKFLPIDVLIKRAQKIPNDMIMGCLQECTTKNWYSNYFSLQNTKYQKEHELILSVFKKQREQYHKKEPLLQSKYTRVAASMNIIDSIEESLIKRYDYIMYRSNIDRNTVFFSKLSQRKYQSVGLIKSKIST